MKPAWSLTKEAWDSLLLAFDTDENAAAQKYQLLYQKLTRFFEWRNADYPSERADQTIDRVARKIQEGEKVEDVSSYAYGVARMILLEAAKERHREQAVMDEMPEPITHFEERQDDDPQVSCFERCLGNLPAENRELIITYYTDEKGAKIENRKTLADRLGIPMNALRIRAHRIRAKLEECVQTCVSGA